MQKINQGGKEKKCPGGLQCCEYRFENRLNELRICCSCHNFVPAVEEIKKPLCRIKPPHGPCKVCDPEEKKLCDCSDLQLDTFGKHLESCHLSQEQKKEECSDCKLFGTMGVHSFTCPIRNKKIEISVSPQSWEVEFREYFDKCLKPKKPTIKNLDRELVIDFINKTLASQKEELKGRINELETDYISTRASSLKKIKMVEVVQLEEVLKIINNIEE